MTIIELKERHDISDDTRLNGLYLQFGILLGELRKRELSIEAMAFINRDVERINASSLSGSELRKLVKKEQADILKHLEKEAKLVAKNHYRNLWMALGFTVFGLPIGSAFSMSTGNMGLLSIGLPIGMAIGLAVGTSMDKKALREGRQLDLEIKY